MANLSNINDKFLVTTGGDVLIGSTAAVSGKLQVTGTTRIAASSTYYSDRTYLGDTWEFASDTTDGVTFKITGGGASTTGNYFRFQTQAGGATADTKLIIDKSGNVGIGMTPDTSWGSDCTVLNIGVGNADAGHLAWREMSGADQLSVGWNLYHDNTDWRYASNNPASLYTQRVGEHTFYTAVSGSADAIVSWTQAMHINESGTITLEGDKTITTSNTLRLNAGGGTLYLDSATDVLLRTSGTSQALVVKADGDVYNYQSSNKANTYYGYNAGNYGGAGLSNTAIGYDASPSLAAGANNISIGRDAGKALTIGTLNISIGNGAGFSNVDGTQNTYVGSYAGYTSPGQNYNTFVGRECGYYNAANESTAVGRNAMHANTSGVSNTAMGAQALAANQTGGYNAAFGYQAQSNSTSGNNTAVGYRAGYYFTSGSDNVCIGSGAGFSSSTAATGNYNTIIGTEANGGVSGLTGDYNVFVGRRSGFGMIAGEQNVIIGLNAGYATATNLAGSVFIGYQTGYSCTWNYTIGIGHNALVNQTSGEYNVGIGKDALGTNQTANRNTALGYQTLKSSIGHYNTAVGMQALYTQGNASYNTATGVHAGYNITTGSQHTLIGYEAGKNIADTEGNTCVGMRAALSLTGNYNVALGIQAMYNASTADYNTCVGNNSGLDISSGDKNTFLGPFAGQNNTTGYENTAVGYNAMGDGITTGSANIAIGPENAKITSGDGNIVMGYAALGVGGVTTGDRNICIGDACGYEITSANYNVLVGQNCGRNTTGTNSLNHIITGAAGGEIQLGNTGHLSAYINCAWTVVSDKRDKTKIESITKGLDFVNQLNPVAYERRIKREKEETDGKKRYGFLAQDILALEGDNPVIVKNHDENLLTMTSDYLIPILVKSIQELKAEIEILKSNN